MTEIKQITFSELHRLSTENIERFNQNIWTEKLLEEFPEIKDKILVVEILIEHYHYRGEPIEKHYRTQVVGSDYVDSILLQDMSIEQWDNLLDVPQELIKETKA